LEVRLSRPGFDEVGLDLGFDPKALYEAYQALRRAGALPESGIVAGEHLEQAAAGGFPPGVLAPGGAALPEPEWTDGEDARSVMGRL
jgi:hypothetical protein